MTQLHLFDYKRVTQDVFELTHGSRAEAANIAALLFREQIQHGIAEPRVTFHDIVKTRLGIEGDAIPEAHAEIYAEHLKAVRDDRLAILTFIQDTGEFVVAVVDAIGRPAIRSGGSPSAAFILRASDAGAEDSVAQVKMSVGKLRRTIEREHSIQRLNKSQAQRLLAAASVLESGLQAPRN